MIKEGVSSDGWRDMVKVLFSDHEQLIMLYNEALVLAEDDGDAASADLITDRLRAHKKHAWMLKSTLD